MEQVRKRIRTNDNSNGRAESSDTDLTNDDQELVQTIPTLVSEIVLEELRDVKLLKTCRLVCKSWNVAASKSLRACSVVSIDENSEKLKDFAALLRKRELPSFQHFPSPFQNFHVEGRSFTDPTFINLVCNPSFICTSLIQLLLNEDGYDSMDLEKSQLSKFLLNQVKHIEELNIFYRDITRNVVIHLTNTRFQLRRLALFDSGFVPNVCPQEWHSFLENVSPSLIHFETNLPIGTKLWFPKLKEISIQNYKNVLSAFTPHNFPSLTKIDLFIETSILPSWENCTVPHTGVQYFDIGAYVDMYDDVGQDLFLLLTFVSRQFPKVTSLDFSVRRFESSTLTDIWKAFPSLKSLKLDGECNFFSFSGFTTSSLNHGLPFELIPRRGSILDFRDLEVIKFGFRFLVSPDMIRHCLPRIRKLKHLELYWNGFLSASLLRDFVGHLDKIVISDSIYSAAETVQLQQFLPNSVLLQ